MMDSPGFTWYGLTFDLSFFGLANTAVAVILVVYVGMEIMRFVKRRRGN